MRFLHLVIEAMRSVTPGRIRARRPAQRRGGDPRRDGHRRLRADRRGPRRRWVASTTSASPTAPGASYVKDSTGPGRGGGPVRLAGPRRDRACPTLVGQRIRDVGTAEHAIKAGHADLVGMARALIADPDLPVKSQTGRLDEIRGCLGINQDCRAFDPHLHCAVNAEVGRGRPAGVGVQVSRRQGDLRDRWWPGRAGGGAGQRGARSPGHPLRARHRSRRSGAGRRGVTTPRDADRHRRLPRAGDPAAQGRHQPRRADLSGRPRGDPGARRPRRAGDRLAASRRSRRGRGRGAPSPSTRSSPATSREPSPARRWCTTRATASGRPTAPPRRSRSEAGRSPW